MASVFKEQGTGLHIRLTKGLLSYSPSPNRTKDRNTKDKEEKMHSKLLVFKISKANQI